MSTKTQYKGVHGSGCSLPLDTILHGHHDHCVSSCSWPEMVNDAYSSPPSFCGGIWLFAAVLPHCLTGKAEFEGKRNRQALTLLLHGHAAGPTPSASITAGIASTVLPVEAFI